MKHFVCLLLALVLLPLTAAWADLDDWESTGDDGFSIRYPDYMAVYGVPEEETGWNMLVLEDPDGRDENGRPQILLYVLRADEATWSNWKEMGSFPNIYGEYEPMQKLTVDEPPILDEPEELVMHVTMDMSYSLYQSMDGKWWQEVFIFDHPTADDFVVICHFPANDGGWYSNVLHWMIATMEFDDMDDIGNGAPYAGSCSFSLLVDNIYDNPYQEIILDEEAEPMWLFADPAVSSFVLEEVEWDDPFTLSGVTPLYTDDLFTPDEALAIYAYVPDMMPVLRVRGINAEGAEEVWYVSESGEDGSLMLIPAADVE